MIKDILFFLGVLGIVVFFSMLFICPTQAKTGIGILFIVSSTLLIISLILLEKSKHMNFKDLKFYPLPDSDGKSQAKYVCKNGQFITVTKNSDNSYNAETIPTVDFIPVVKNGIEQEVLDFINEVAQVVEPSIGLEDFDLDEED